MTLVKESPGRRFKALGISPLATAAGQLAASSLVLLPLVNAALGFLGFYALVGSTGAAWADPWIAVAFAAFYLMLLRCRTA